MLKAYLAVGFDKPVSYLPIKTVKNVIGISVSACKSMIEGAGNKCVVLGASACCISSGAIYAYSEPALMKILNHNRDLLSSQGWSADADSFIKNIALQWRAPDDPLMPVIKASFGD